MAKKIMIYGEEAGGSSDLAAAVKIAPIEGMDAQNVQSAIEEVSDNLTSIVKSVTTDWIPLTFNNQSQVAINTISALTNGKVTDYTQIKGISVVSNGYINAYASSNNSIYAFITNLNATTSNLYKIRLTIFY